MAVAVLDADCDGGTPSPPGVGRSGFRVVRDFKVFRGFN